MHSWKLYFFIPMLSLFFGCASMRSHDVYHSENMDFGSVQTVAVLPFTNLSKEDKAEERVRDVFMTMLLSTGSIYVVPPGEVARGALMAGITNPRVLSAEDVKKLGPILKVDAIISGVVREYGNVNQQSTTAQIISISIQMSEVQTGRIVWSGSSTQGGIGVKERLLGGGGQPMNDITEKAVNDVLNKLFK
ncbi:MAG TPA: GNA1162 family protein [Nitrospirota bacterium]|nr:GNA1162 family protein [Nitrospirota bacterium]